MEALLYLACKLENIHLLVYLQQPNRSRREINIKMVKPISSLKGNMINILDLRKKIRTLQPAERLIQLSVFAHMHLISYKLIYRTPNDQEVMPKGRASKHRNLSCSTESTEKLKPITQTKLPSSKMPLNQWRNIIKINSLKNICFL